MTNKYTFPPIDLLNGRYDAPVMLRKLIESDEFKSLNSVLPVAIGKKIEGEHIFADFDEMQNLLIAGISGIDISACINSMIISMLYRKTPDDVNFIMIDPNSNELDIYNGIPYLIGQVITDTKRAVAALQWTMEEMTYRYKRFFSYNNGNKHVKVRDVSAWNDICKLSGSQSMKTMPKIVIVINEISSFMEEYKNDFEDSLVRLSQIGRNAGIYMLIATKKPSSDVITGLVKDNIPSKIAFAVSSEDNLKSIIECDGAEPLSMDGEMLFFPKGYYVPERVQGSFVSDTEIKAVTNYIRDQDIKREYSARIWEKILDLEKNFQPCIF